MNCKFTSEHIMAAAYGELPADQVYELEQHIASCQNCRKEYEEMESMKDLLSAYPVAEPEANLLARAHIRLDAALDQLPPRHWYTRLGQRLFYPFAILKAAPIATCALLLLGVGAGSFSGYQIARSHDTGKIETAILNNRPASTAAPVPPPIAEISSVSSIVHDPGSNIVEVHYNEVTPQQIRGSMDDPKIRQILMLATANSTSQDVRDNSVGLLADACRSGQTCQGTGARDALMVALRYNRSAKVREKALQGLEPYVAEDVRVRNAVLEALMNDSDARIRNSAINILEPVQADTSVRQVLHSVAYSDQSPEVRTVSRQILSRQPEIQ